MLLVLACLQRRPLTSAGRTQHRCYQRRLSLFVSHQTGYLVVALACLLLTFQHFTLAQMNKASALEENGHKLTAKLATS